MTNRQRWLRVVVALAGAGIVSGQENVHPNVLLNQSPSQTNVWPCTAETNLEGDDDHQGQYKIVRTTVDDPFKFLYWISGKQKALQAQLQAKLNGQPFTYSLAEREALDLIEKQEFLPITGRGFEIRVEFVSVQNCNPNAKTVELIYRIYSTNPPKFLGGAAEAQTTAEKSPQSTTGLSQSTASSFHFTPSGGYNRSYGSFGGGHVEINHLPKFRLFDTFTAEGSGSYSMHSISLALSGSVDRFGWLKHSDWKLNYANSSVPAGPVRLKQATLSGQIDGETRPFWNGTTFARFGGLIEGGNTHNNVQDVSLAPQTALNAGYGLLRGFAGISSRTTHNVLSLSYGLELGSIGPTAEIDWRRHIVDTADDFWFSIGDHKPLEVESRFTAGGIQVPHSIPLSSRFFGGSVSEYFVPGDSWQIRDVPVIRAIPANQFYLTGQGAGASEFAAINLTVAYPVYAHPIMPKDVSQDKEFNQLLNGQIVSATSTEQNYYSWKDPKFASAYGKLGALKQPLDRLQNAVNMAQTAHPDEFPDEFDNCTTSLAVASFDLTNALKTTKIDQYGDVQDLVNPTPPPSVHDSCVGQLNQQLHDPSIATAAADYDAALKAISDDFNAIDQKAAQTKAANDIAFVKRTLNTLFKDLDIYSISPVAVVDSAWIGPAKGPLGGNRIGPGGGIRLELVSYVNFTLGYAWNVNRQPGEGKGAVFFSIGIRDLFH